MMLRSVTALVTAATLAVPSVSPADIVFRSDVLRPGSARQAGLLPDRIDALRAVAESYLVPTADHPDHPAYAGAVVLAARHGVVVRRFAVGDAVRYASAGAELPPERRVAARPDTIWDLASISKLFTTIVLLQQAEAGRVDLDVPVAAYLPEFGAGGKGTVTARHLLTHTSGLPAFRPLWRDFPTPPARLAAALATPLDPGTSPGSRYLYSDIGLIALGALIERVTGTGLADAVRDGVTRPLGMRDTAYNPSPAVRHRVAATEDQAYAGRGLIRGEVHDENAWGLGGVAGHAGLFSTADDLARLCQMLLDGGAYRGRRLLSTATVRAALTAHTADGERGLGFELNKHLYMDAMASPVTFGHTGFTGTSVVIDPLAQSFLILLSNRVHPDRGWGTNVVARRALARTFADAHPVRPARGPAAWRADRRDSGTVTLTGALRRPVRPGAIASFLLWYDTEPRDDVVTVESSADGITWTPLPATLRAGREAFTGDGSFTGFGGRRWWRATAPLPAGVTALRWSYRTDAEAQGRGVYVDDASVSGAGPLTFSADGWRPAAT